MLRRPICYRGRSFSKCDGDRKLGRDAFEKSCLLCARETLLQVRERKTDGLNVPYRSPLKSHAEMSS
jgi:hypothetical protein